MRVAILGDSFTYTYNETWIENICKELNFNVVFHVGHRGHSQFKIYKSFLACLNLNPDVIIYVYTGYSRLYNERYPLSTNTVFQSALANIISNPELKKATQHYYNHLYDDSFAKTIDILLIRDIQEQCKKRNIKLVNMPAFEHNHMEKNYGLWIFSNGGLNELCMADFKKTTNKDWNDGNFNDDRLNHFSSSAHRILSDQIVLHIKNYINSDQEFHIALLFPELFA